MKKLLVCLFLITTIHAVQAQKKIRKSNKDAVEFKVDSTSVLTIDSTIKAFYAVISGAKETKRNWTQFKFLFKPDAKLIPSGEDKQGNYRVHYMSPEDYIKSSGPWLIKNGYFEKELHRKTDGFGNIATVVSTFESFNNEADTEPIMRGIKNLQLVFDGLRWWIVNIHWAQETAGHPIPKTYLP